MAISYKLLIQKVLWDIITFKRLEKFMEGKCEYIYEG